MELSLLVLRESAILFFMVLAGFLLAKSGLVQEKDCAVLSRITVYLFMPCLLFNSFMARWTQETLYNLFVSILAAVAVHILFVLIAYLAPKLFPISRVDSASLIYTNVGAIMPLVMGTIGVEYVPYTAGFMMVSNLFLWTHGVWLLGGREAIQPKKVLKSPAIIAIFLGLAVMALSIELPDLLLDVTQDMGSCMAPVSMIQIGIVCAGFDLAHLRRIRTVWITIGLRLLAVPVLVILTLSLLHRALALPDSWEVFFVVMLSASGPSGVVVTQLAQLYNMDTDRASCISVVTTALCALTLPLMTLLAQIIL